jgi:hypothetical protein
VGTTCTFDEGSDYYNYFKDESYPEVVCKNACGPFVHQRNHVSPFRSKLEGTDVSHYIWEALFGSPYLPWFLVLVLSVLFSMRTNTIEVLKDTQYQKDRSFEAQLQTSKAEVKRLEKLIAKLKSIT